MSSAEFFWGAAFVLLVVLVFPFVLLLSAKLMSYGWASGRDKFEQDRAKKRI